MGRPNTKKCMSEVWKTMLSQILDVSSNDSFLQFFNVKEKKVLTPSMKMVLKLTLKNSTTLVKTDGCLPMNQSSRVSWLVDPGCKSVSSQQNTKIYPVVLSCKLSMTNAEVILNVHTRLLFVWHVIHASISLEIFTKL